MTRDEYQKFMLRLYQKKQAKKNLFLKNLPMFQHWPTKWLNKLQDGFNDETFIRNQQVYCEGDTANDIYLIHSGEFLLTKRVPVKEEHSVQLDKLIGPNQSSLQEQVKPFDQKVVHSSLGDKGPKSAAQTNPNPEKSDQQTLAKTRMHGAFKLI